MCACCRAYKLMCINTYLEFNLYTYYIYIYKFRGLAIRGFVRDMLDILYFEFFVVLAQRFSHPLRSTLLRDWWASSCFLFCICLILIFSFFSVQRFGHHLRCTLLCD